MVAGEKLVESAYGLKETYDHVALVTVGIFYYRALIPYVKYHILCDCTRDAVDFVKRKYLKDYHQQVEMIDHQPNPNRPKVDNYR